MPGSAIRAIILNPYCSQANVFFNRAGPISTRHKKEIDTLIRGLIHDGLWDKHDQIWMGALPFQSAALLNLKEDRYNLTNTSATFTADQGFTGNGTSATLNTNFNPTTAVSPKYVQDSNCMWAWSGTAALDNTQIFGNTTDASFRNYCVPRGTGDLANWKPNTAGSNGGGASTDASGLWSMNRVAASGAGATQLYRNGAAFANFNNTSQASINTTLAFLSTHTNFSSALLYCGGVGQLHTAADSANLHSRLRRYLQVIAGIA